MIRLSTIPILISSILAQLGSYVNADSPQSVSPLVDHSSISQSINQLPISQSSSQSVYESSIDLSSNFPSDMLDSPWPYVRADVILFIYFAICLLSIKQSITLIRTHSKLLSFRFLFLSLTTVWTALRIGFFCLSRFSVSEEDDPSFNQSIDDSLSDSARWSTQSNLHLLIDLLYYLPAACQLAMFSLVLAYYMKLYHSFMFDWRINQSKIMTFFIAVNVLYLIGTCLFVASTHMTHNQSTNQSINQSINQSVNQSLLDHVELLHQCHFLFSALSFFILLVVCFLYFYRLLMYTDLPRFYFTINQSVNQSINRTVSLQYLYLPSLFFIATVLLTRFLFDAAAALRILTPLFRRQIYETVRGVAIDSTTFCLLVSWEILPTLMVIFGFQDRMDGQQVIEKSCWNRISACFASSSPPVYTSPIQQSISQNAVLDAEAALDEEEAFLSSSLAVKPVDDELSMFSPFSANLLLGSSSQPERQTFYQHIQGYQSINPSINQSINHSNPHGLHSSYPPSRGYYQRFNSAAYPIQNVNGQQIINQAIHQSVG